MWRKMQMKKNEAPFAWRLRMSQPYWTFRHVWATEENASEVSAV